MEKKGQQLTAMTQPFLSIIIPVYNKGKYLDKCLRTIVEQSFTDWEVILIDDGSCDNSPRICDMWGQKDGRIRVTHQTNAGVSSARNTGLKLAAGKYIQFTDADDWWEKNIFEELYILLQSEGFPDVTVFGLKKKYANSHCTLITPHTAGKILRRDFLRSLIHEQHLTGVYGCVANKIIAADLIRRNHLIFNTDYTLLEDYDFMLDVFRCASSIYLTNKAGYIYLQNAENSTSDKTFRINYKQVIQVRIKAYRLVENIVGHVQENKNWLQRELNTHILALINDIKSITFANFKQLVKELTELTHDDVLVHFQGTTPNTKVIAHLLNVKAWFLLFSFLKIKTQLSAFFITRKHV